MKSFIISAILDACDGFISPEITQFSISDNDMIHEKQNVFLESLTDLSDCQKDKIYDAAAELADVYGKVGFQNGFRCAALLMLEIMGP